MSATRALMASLREAMDRELPIGPPVAMARVEAPPVRVFPRAEATRVPEANPDTTALVGIGNVGTRYATDVVLQFQAELAVAREAVATELSPDFGRAEGFIRVQSRVESHREYLLRPDLGRRLADESVARLASEADRDPDIQPILADGLSASACMTSGLMLLSEYVRECQALGLRVGRPILARFARVWLEDEIGQLVGAKVATILLGERPGLGTGDGLSAYLVHEPRIGKVDSDRNMMSNIHPRGTTPEVAGRRLAALSHAMIEQRTSGVTLDLSRIFDEVARVADRGYRKPLPRQRLVERT